METTIEKDLAGVYPERKEPVNYAYKYGQLRGLIIALGCYADSSNADFLRRMVVHSVNRMEEIDRE